MVSGSLKYFLGLLVIVVVLIFIIFRIIGGGGDETVQPKPTLKSYATTSTSVRYTADNPVQSQSGKQELVIEVGRDNATLTIYGGYDRSVLVSDSFPMNEAAYTDFLMALDRTGGFTLGADDEAARDERGYCALGYRYGYDIIDGSGNSLQHYWSTSCKQKTFAGESEAVKRLFERQIPNYRDLTREYDF